MYLTPVNFFTREEPREGPLNALLAFVRQKGNPFARLSTAL